MNVAAENFALVTLQHEAYEYNVFSGVQAGNVVDLGAGVGLGVDTEALAGQFLAAQVHNINIDRACAAVRNAVIDNMEALILVVVGDMLGARTRLGAIVGTSGMEVVVELAPV